MRAASLQSRQEAESTFHDLRILTGMEQSYYAWGFTRPIFETMLKRIGDVQDRRVLEYGCGEAWLGRNLAKRGAAVCSFDISQEAVRIARQKALGLDVKYPLRVDRMPAERLQYDSDQFDIVVGTAILHHTDILEA